MPCNSVKLMIPLNLYQCIDFHLNSYFILLLLDIFGDVLGKKDRAYT